MATYLIGPLLVLNPPFTKWLLRELGAKSDDLAFEDTAVAAYIARLPTSATRRSTISFELTQNGRSHFV